MEKDESKQLTDADKALLKEFLQALDDLAKREPEKLTAEMWDNVWPAIQATGDIPAAYRDRIGVNMTTDTETGETRPAYFDIVWERWNAERNQTIEKYHGIIWKFIKYALENEKATDEMPLDEFLSRFLSNPFADSTPEQVRGLFDSPFLPMLNGAPSNDIMQLSLKGLTPDSFSKKAIFHKNGRKITIEHFDKLQGSLSTSAKKILDTALLYLTANNYYKTGRKGLTPTVEIPLIEYGEACGYQLTPQTMETAEEQTAENRRIQERIKELKKNVQNDLHDIADVLWTGEETRGRNKGDYIEMRIISSHSIRKGLIRINFDIDAAAFFVNAYIMQYPTALLRHDNRKPNAYVIGRKLAFHNSIDNNVAAGTNNTLSVRSLLADAPDIPTIEELQARGQRNWKDKIKKLLEKSIDENIRVGLISKWEYRDPATGKTYTPETAQLLTWAQYSRLMIDFIMVNEPDQSERRQKRTAEKAKAAEAKNKVRRKRGRPKKEMQPSLLE